MKHILLSAVCLTALVVAVLAQEADYQEWMKTVGATSGNLRKNLEAKIGDAASADAKKLQEVFGQVYEFWHKKNVDDAAKFAMNARDGEQASAGKFDESSVTLKATSANCGGCHSARREGAGQFLEDQVILLSKLCVPERSLTVPMA
jgi:mono/diheme cytochrome c family protein